MLEAIGFVQHAPKQASLRCGRPTISIRTKTPHCAGECPVPTLNVVLVSTYELGRQPFGLASPAAWLRESGASVTCVDLSIEMLDDAAIAAADLVAFYVPMHTATRIAASMTQRVLLLNPDVHLCFYGLYAPVNEGFLRELGAHTILGGEFEAGLVALAERLAAGGDAPAAQPQP